MYKFTIIPKTQNSYSDAIVNRLAIYHECTCEKEAEMLCRKWTTDGFCDYIEPTTSGEIAKVFIPASSIQMVLFRKQ